MRPAALRRLAVVLAAAGIAVVTVGAFLVADRLRDARRDARAAELRGRFEDHVRTAVHALERLVDEAGRIAGAEGLEEDAKPPLEERAENERFLRRLQPSFKSLDAPDGAALAVYDVFPTPQFRGVATTSAVDADPGTTWEGRLSSAAVEVLARVDVIEGWVRPNAGHVWFSEEKAGGVRLHRTLLFREFALDDDAKPPEMTEAAYLVDASAPFRPPSGVFASVRCDVGAGRILPDLPLRAVGGDRASGDAVTVALDPARSPWEFAAPGAAARAELRFPSPPLFDAFGALAAASVALLVLALALAVLGRRRPAPPPPDVTAEAAHEMRTPLTAMRGSLEVALRREREPKEYREALEVCLEEVKGLQSLIDAVLFLGRGAQVSPSREPVDLRALAEGEVSRLKASQPERQIALEGDAGPAVVSGDPSLLARALGNLLDNAAHHSVPGGAIRVAVSARDGRVVVTVEDAGPGIPEARRERVFERFYRGPEAGRRGIPGAGLGLPIARWIAEIHGGTLVLDPEPTDRARFRLALPAG